jgi:hypothetical protein
MTFMLGRVETAPLPVQPIILDLIVDISDGCEVWASSSSWSKRETISSLFSLFSYFLFSLFSPLSSSPSPSLLLCVDTALAAKPESTKRFTLAAAREVSSG